MQLLYFFNFTFTVKGMATTISSKGQVTVPRKFREELGLIAGTKLEFERGEHGTLICRKAADQSFFARFQGTAKNSGLPYAHGDEAVSSLRGRVEEGDVD